LHGSIRRHRLGLKSHTRRVHLEEFVKTYVDANGHEYNCHFQCFDVEGFSGDQENDLEILLGLLDELRESLTKIHVIYYCLTAVRMSDSEAATLKLVVDYGGPELGSRIRFIMTNAPARLIREDPTLKPEAAAKLSSIVGHLVRPDEIITSDIPDPNQYEETDLLYQATMGNWIQHQVNSQNIVRDIPEEEAFRISKLSRFHKLWARTMVRRNKNFLGLALLVILIMVIQALASYEKMREIIEKTKNVKMR
jgi:hypothetical protein